MGSNIDPGTGSLINRLANPPNPMQQLGQTIQGVSALKDFQARNAMAGIYSQAIDPTTGEVDQGLLNRLIGANPAAAWNAGPAMQQAGQAVGAQGTGTQNRVAGAQAMLSGISGFLGPIYGDGKSPIPADQAMQMLERARALNIATPEMINNVEGQINQLGPNGNARDLVNGMVFATGAGLEQLHLRGQGGYQDVGTGLIRTAPAAAGSTPDYLPRGLTPEGALKLQSYLAEPYDYTDKQGVEHRGGTKADFFQQNHINPFAAFTDGTIPAPGTAPSIPQVPQAPQGGGGGASPPTAGSTPGAGNWEVQHNNFAGMRNPNVPAAGGPNTNPRGWQQFDTPEAGVQAISNQLDRYASGATTGTPLTTIRGIVSTWAPASDGNPTPTLINRASQIVGVGPDQPLDLSNPAVKSKLVEAMIRNEQGGALPPTAAAAIPKVFGGGQGAVSQTSATTGPTEAVPASVAKDSSDQFKAARANATQFEARTSGLSQALGLLRQNEKLAVGPGTQDLQNLQGIANAWGIDLPKAMKDNNTAFSEINKDLERYYMTLPGAQRSDLAQAEQKMANPSAQTQQREALDDLITRTIGLERMNNAAYLNFEQKHGRQASVYAPQYADDSAQYMQNLDPVGFAFNLMTPAERTSYRNSLKGPELTNYYNSIKEASRLYNLPITGG